MSVSSRSADSAEAVPIAPRTAHRRHAALLAFLAVGVFTALRGLSERAMMAEFGSDPQMAIWLMFLIVKLALWGLGGGLLAGLVVLLWQRRWGRRIAVMLLLGWTVAISVASVNYLRGKSALAEARDPASSPARLEQLFDFSGIQAGYELDNRLTIHPQAPPELLRKLYDRHQQGTLMVLARNPRTPADILEKLVEVDSHDEWIRRSLRQNPSLSKLLEKKLDEREPPVVKPGHGHGRP